jgi:hypothetical protein
VDAVFSNNFGAGYIVLIVAILVLMLVWIACAVKSRED